MEKARKETESTRCPRPGLIPAVLQGISSRETFLAIGSRSRGAAGFPFFCVFFPPFHPIRPCGAELPAVGRQRKVMKAMSEESKCLKLVFFAQNWVFFNGTEHGRTPILFRISARELGLHTAS